MNLKKINRALISVSDKSELTKILKILKKFKVEILSSGGTYKKINRLGYKSIEISDFTNSPEILDGRVKTLHPKLYGGILFKRNNKKHQKQIKKIDIKKIDLVIVNFYPFEEAVKTGNDKKIIENIDIGGPTLVRAAAKNYEDVTVITDTSQYIALQNEMNKYRGSTSLNFRKILSRDAFLETGYYDTKITEYLNKANNDSPPPKKKLIGGNLVENLRYGENPHQGASVYSLNKEINIKQLNGKKLSYNNYNDIFTGISLSKSFTKDYSTVIIKHANPCGVALDKRKINSYLKAYECDPTSAFGGIISCNYNIKNNDGYVARLGDDFLSIDEVKNQIPNNLRSCHSAQIGKYIIEGHVPIESINKLLEEKPLISGLAVPGMPHGSPGMEIHSHESHSHDYESYEVVAFSESEKTKIFDKISP